jgi:hypothetical protein
VEPVPSLKYPATVGLEKPPLSLRKTGGLVVVLVVSVENDNFLTSILALLKYPATAGSSKAA